MLAPAHLWGHNGRMSAPDSTNLGRRVVAREFNWLDLVMKSWGSEFNAPDHGTYEFSNGRKYDSTDRGSAGIYGIEVTSPKKESV